MARLDVALIAAILRLYPRTFRARFGDELLAAYLDQRETLTGRAALARHLTRTALGLLRALPAVHAQQRAHRVTAPLDHSHETHPMSQLGHDLRHTIRLLRQQPGFAVLAILTLALGIGANTAVFSVLNGVILAPLPYDEPHQLVRLYTAYERNPEAREYLTGPDLVEIRDQVEAFSSVGISYTYQEEGADLTGPAGQPQRVRVLQVSAGYFPTLRATPLLGRTFTSDEERHGVRRLVMSHALWSAATGRDSAVVGRSIELNGEPYEVIGVMRSTFHDVVAGDVAGWVPVGLEPDDRNTRGNHYLSAVARLRPGVSVSQARAQVSAVMHRLATEFPNSNAERRMRVVPLHDDVVGEASSTVWVLMGAAGMVLLIACVNVANLFITRALAQSRETAIRTALGAARGRLVRHRLTESLAVAVAGGAAGSLVAGWGVTLLLALSPQSLPRAESIGFDARLLGFAIVVTALTGLLFGAWPAFRAARVDPRDALHEGGRGTTVGRGSRRARSVLVASQVSVSVVLLVGAGVLMRSFAARQAVALGFTPASVATFEVHLPPARYGDPRARIGFHDAYQERLRALPGVEAVGVTSWLPANGFYHGWGFLFVDPDASEGGQRLSTQVRIIDGDYLEALRIPLRRGRSFAATDRLEADSVALISESLARRAYGDRDPIGQRFRAGPNEFTIVGVVGDVAHLASGTRGPMTYLSHDQYAPNRHWALTYVVRTTVDPRRIIDPARRALAGIDPALVLHQPRTMDGVLAQHRARARFTVVLMTVFATIALALAAVGVYGVLSHAVAQRTHEIGVRLALGARPAQLRAIVLRQGVGIAAVGMVVGLGGALALSRVLESLAFGVSPRDPIVFGTVALVLMAVVVLASYVPARRATRVNPLESLRRG